MRGETLVHRCRVYIDQTFCLVRTEVGHRHHLSFSFLSLVLTVVITSPVHAGPTLVPLIHSGEKNRNMQALALLMMGLSAAASASVLRRQVHCSNPGSFQCEQEIQNYLSEVCMPINATGGPDFNAPCVAAQLIEFECMYGSRGVDFVLGNDPNGASYSEQAPPLLSNATQRDCLCESQFFNEVQGCLDCYTAHGGEAFGDGINTKQLSSMRSSYCAVTNTPTQGLAEVLYSLVPTTSSASSSATSTFSDPIGNKTAVSYYFTPSVTGSAAWSVAEATMSASNMTAVGSSGTSTTSMSVFTSNGQIVPTAGASSASGSAKGTSTSSGSGPQETAAVAGMIALAGFVALL